MTKERPNVNSLGNKELDKAEKQFEAFEEGIKDLTLDRMNASPKVETEPQTKLSQKEIARIPEIYLKPLKNAGCREPFNENYRKNWEHDKVYVPFIAENNEIKGDRIEMWTKPYAGVGAEFWHVPVNKPVWGPRYLANQISRCTYHRLKMRETAADSNPGVASEMTHEMVSDTTIARLEARPVSQQKQVFLGAGNF